MRSRQLSVIYLLVLLAIVTACGKGNPRSASDNTPAQTETEPAAAYFVREDGSRFTLTDLQGQRVFVNYWATWCKPCLEEMPALDSARVALQETGIRFIAASNESEEKVSGFRDQNAYGFEIVRYTGDLSDLSIYALPTSMLFDEQGTLLITFEGAHDWMDPQILTQLSNAAP